jgi:hypothetical protein
MGAMKAAIFNGTGEITVGMRPDPVIREPSDAIVRQATAIPGFGGKKR